MFKRAKNNRAASFINSTSSADMAFILLIFFLLTSSMNTEKGVSKQLETESSQEAAVPFHLLLDLRLDDEGNLFRIIHQEHDRKVNLTDQELSQLLYEFLWNPEKRKDFPPQTFREHTAFGRARSLEKSVTITLRTKPQTPFGKYVHIQDEIRKAYLRIWKEIAGGEQSYAQLSSDDLDFLQQELFPYQLTLLVEMSDGHIDVA